VRGLVGNNAAAASKFSEWSAPVNLGPIVNSSFNEFGPAVSKDELSLYFTSARPDGFGNTDIYVSQRSSRDEPRGIPGEPGTAGQHVFRGANARPLS
jgi:hypothetical protein